MAVCQAGAPVETWTKDMINQYNPGYVTGCPSVHRRALLRIAHPYSGAIHINEPCITNEYISLMSRHLVVRERDITPLVVSACKEAFDILRNLYPPEPLTKYSFEQVVLSKPTSLRAKARNAVQTVMREGLCRKDEGIRMFIKNERMSYTSTGGFKPPRAIQARSPQYTVVLQRYIMPYSKKWRRMQDPPILVGFDGAYIATTLYNAWVSYDDPVAVLLDHRKFDSGVHTEWLKQEHSYYIDHFRNDTELVALLEVQLRNKCKTANGVRYSMIGTRCSGDANTSSGNSTVNLAMLLRLFRGVKSHTYNIGDDSVVILARQSFNHLFNLGRMLELGRDYLWETPYNIVDVFEHIEFCQCRPVNTISGWLMVRDPERVLTRASYCIAQNVTDLTMLKRWMKGVGLCEQSVNPGVPVLQQFGAWMAAQTRAVPIYEPNYKPWLRAIPYCDNTITASTRLSFAKAFNVSVDQQLRLEHYFRRATIDNTITRWQAATQALLSVKDEQ